MKLFLKLFTIFIGLVTQASALENLVYTWRGFPTAISAGTNAINDLKNHISKINILSSQAYHISQKGIVYGSMNPQMLSIAAAAHIKIMPLIGNSDFDRQSAHLFLHDKAAQERAIASILQLCQQNHFAGMQIDFENMSFTDRDVFSQFYQKTAKVLHQHGFQISVAIIPTLTDELSTDYLKGRFMGWSGVYDYKALGESSDFVTLMAYDQHGTITPSGPMAGLSYDEAIIKYTLKFIPADKISLGLPWHSGYWHTGKATDGDNRIHAAFVTLTYPNMLRLLQDNNAILSWDNADKIHYAMFKNHFLYEYIFVEDADSYRAKLDLVKQYHLRGVSNWCLGEEDPKVWDLW